MYRVRRKRLLASMKRQPAEGLIEHCTRTLPKRVAWVVGARVEEPVRRELVGYGRKPPKVGWPNGARLAVSIVLNYEEGSERSFAAGDDTQETGTEWGQYPFPADVRNLAMESVYEYGSRVGVWRIFEVVESFGIPLTVFACAVALELNPPVAEHIRNSNHEVCSHGYRWEEVFTLTAEEEARNISRAVESLERTVGRRPVGWYCRYGASERTRQLIVAAGGFLYDSDSYADDCPYLVEVGEKQHLVVPYTPDNNDFRYWQANGPTTAHAFTTYLVDAFDERYREGGSSPRMMSVGLHPRIIGRPGRIRALRDFLEYATKREHVWFASREQIAAHWLAQTR